MIEGSSALHELITLIEDYHDFNPSTINIAPESPDAVKFSKQVSKGLPCVYPAAAVLQNHASRNWTRERLCELVIEDVEVAVTPDGRADALCSISGTPDSPVAFLQPANVNMNLQQLFRILETACGSADPVYYLQSQNSNLTTTPLQQLLQDLPSNFDFARPVLDEPEAINVWIGDDRSVTSAHRDPYENLYIVLKGSKTFTLWPPVEELCMSARMVPTGRYMFDPSTGTFTMALDMDDKTAEAPPVIPWVPIDPLEAQSDLTSQFPLYAHAHPRSVTVSEGQMLYLPSGWYHHVTQQCGIWDDGSKAPCIAVNYWYDMDYEGEKYAMRQLLSRLAQQAHATQQP